MLSNDASHTKISVIVITGNRKGPIVDVSFTYIIKNFYLNVITYNLSHETILHYIVDGLIVNSTQEFKPYCPVPALDFQYIVPN